MKWVAPLQSLEPGAPWAGARPGRQRRNSAAATARATLRAVGKERAPNRDLEHGRAASHSGRVKFALASRSSRALRAVRAPPRTAETTRPTRRPCRACFAAAGMAHSTQVAELRERRMQLLDRLDCREPGSPTIIQLALPPLNSSAARSKPSSHRGRRTPLISVRSAAPRRLRAQCGELIGQQGP